MKVNQQENTQHCSSTKSLVGITEQLVFNGLLKAEKVGTERQFNNPRIEKYNDQQPTAMSLIVYTHKDRLIDHY